MLERSVQNTERKRLGVFRNQCDTSLRRYTGVLPARCVSAVCTWRSIYHTAGEVGIDRIESYKQPASTPTPSLCSSRPIALICRVK